MSNLQLMRLEMDLHEEELDLLSSISHFMHFIVRYKLKLGDYMQFTVRKIIGVPELRKMKDVRKIAFHAATPLLECCCCERVKARCVSVAIAVTWA